MLLLTKFFIALLQSAIAAIILRSMCDGGSGEIFVVEMYGVYETFDVGGFYVASMCSVVLW